jgi:hypothetical protein
MCYPQWLQFHRGGVQLHIFSGLRMSFEGFMFGVIVVMVVLYAMAWINGDVQNQLPQKRIETFFIFLGVAVFVGLIASIP